METFYRHAYAVPNWKDGRVGKRKRERERKRRTNETNRKKVRESEREKDREKGEEESVAERRKCGELGWGWDSAGQDRTG